MQTTHDLPTHFDRVLENLIAAARQVCGAGLRPRSWASNSWTENTIHLAPGWPSKDEWLECG